MKVTVSHSVGGVSTSVTLELTDDPNGNVLPRPGMASPNIATAQALTTQAISQVEASVRRQIGLAAADAPHA